MLWDKIFQYNVSAATVGRTFEQSVLQGHRFHWNIGTLRVMGLWTTGHSGGIGARKLRLLFRDPDPWKENYFSVEWKKNENLIAKVYKVFYQSHTNVSKFYIAHEKLLKINPRKLLPVLLCVYYWKNGASCKSKFCPCQSISHYPLQIFTHTLPKESI